MGLYRLASAETARQSWAATLLLASDAEPIALP
jgi:hypothetical protein